MTATLKVDGLRVHILFSRIELQNGAIPRGFTRRFARVCQSSPMTVALLLQRLKHHGASCTLLFDMQSELYWILEEVGSGIRALIDKFFESPYFFYSEQDMHAYLYHKLISGRLGGSVVQTHFGDTTVLVHREYPTLHTYPGKRSGKRGRFDLAILDPAHVSESHWRMQTRAPPYSRHRLKAAIEFGLNAIGTTRLDLTHFKKDFERLTNPRNRVERSYLLFFVRRQDYIDSSGLLRVIRSLPEKIEQEYDTKRDHASNLAIVYAECQSPGSGDLKIIPENRSTWVR